MQETTGDTSFIPGLGRSPGERYVNPLQYSYLETPMDRGAWRAMVHRIAKSQTRLKWLSTHAYIQLTIDKCQSLSGAYGNLVRLSNALNYVPDCYLYRNQIRKRECFTWAKLVIKFLIPLYTKVLNPSKWGCEGLFEDSFYPVLIQKFMSPLMWNKRSRQHILIGVLKYLRVHFWIRMPQWMFVGSWASKHEPWLERCSR